MKEILTTITQRGQVTIPAEVRKLLGVRPKDKVAFTIDAGRVELTPAQFTVETAYQSIPPLTQPLSDEEMAELAKDGKAVSALQELRGQTERALDRRYQNTHTSDITDQPLLRKRW